VGGALQAGGTACAHARTRTSLATRSVWLEWKQGRRELWGVNRSGRASQAGQAHNLSFKPGDFRE
jgi:hypothetical protein